MLKFLWPFVYMIKMVNTVQFLLGLLSELVVFFFPTNNIHIYSRTIHGAVYLKSRPRTLDWL